MNFGKNPAPIPYAERQLPTKRAEYFFKAFDQKCKHIEGLCFDREQNLYYCSNFDGSIFRVDMKTKEQTEVFRDETVYPVSVKIHKDGRLFISCCAHSRPGRIYAINPDGTGYQEIVEGFDNIDDVVFDEEGGFYFTHFSGSVNQPTGGVYYVTPDFKTVTPVVPNLARPNGVTLSTDGRVLWITEMAANRLLRVSLEKGDIPTFPSVPYQFTGMVGPDSCEIDADDNLYVAMYGQGRVLVFNYYGFPIGQIVLPGQELGRNLRSSHPIVRPGNNELYICCADDEFDEGSWIMKAESFGKGYEGSYQFT